MAPLQVRQGLVQLLNPAPIPAFDLFQALVQGRLSPAAPLGRSLSPPVIDENLLHRAHRRSIQISGVGRPSRRLLFKQPGDPLVNQASRRQRVADRPAPPEVVSGAAQLIVHQLIDGVSGRDISFTGAIQEFAQRR
jgi:hypothetical protein